MSNFRKNRGKTPTSPVQVPRSGASRRDLKAPQPEPHEFDTTMSKAFDLSNGSDRTVGAVFGVGTMNFGGAPIGSVVDMSVAPQNGPLPPEIQITLDVRPDALDSAQVEQIVNETAEQMLRGELARRAVADVENLFLHGTTTTAPIPTRQRINLIQGEDWPAFVRRLDIRTFRTPVAERDAFVRFRPETDADRPSSAYTAYREDMLIDLQIDAHGDMRGTPAIASLMALHNRVVAEGLDQAVAAIERAMYTNQWVASFIFNPDGVPSLCGILDLGGSLNYVVCGVSFRNFHVYRPYHAMHYHGGRGAVQAAVRDFLTNAHREANPGLTHFLRE